jgi:Choline dehydrogenase and related flavoproteins
VEFDYVIVGGGSAGSVMAARLSEDPGVTVCLLEAGGEGRDFFVRAPLGTVLMLPGRPLKLNNWMFRTEPQAALGGRRGFQPRGRALGGSSAINAMLYIRGHRTDYDDWVRAGCDGWGFDDVLPFFLKAERNSRGAGALHGDSGPLQVGDQSSPCAISRAFIAAAGLLQVRETDDFNGPEQEGAGLYQVTQFFDGEKRGERCSAAAAYLHPVMGRPNLHVVTGAHATKVVLEGRRATGVLYRRGRRPMQVSARREVIVSAGAFGSPQLLMLSGIGPGAELSRHGIPVVHELSGVGRNLQDHPDFIWSYKTASREGIGLSPSGTLAILRAISRWRRDGTGLVSTPGAEAGAFLRSDPALDRPDLQLHFVVGIVDEHARKLHPGYGYSCHVCVLRPHSRGEVGLKSPDPLAPPRIDPRFLSDERDMALMLKGAKMTRAIMEAEALAPYRGRELYSAGKTTDEEILAEIRARCDTIYHPVGTCRMGRDEGAVTTPDLKVKGVGGLRVVDASVMPTLIGGNTNAPTIMIAEKISAAMRAA